MKYDFRKHNRLATVLYSYSAFTHLTIESFQSSFSSRWRSSLSTSTTKPRDNTFTSSNPSSKDLPHRVRTCMRQVPHPIVVVTASGTKSQRSVNHAVRHSVSAA
jgi:hypothetical protein